MDAAVPSALPPDDLARAERFLAERTPPACSACGHPERPALFPLALDMGGPSGNGAFGLPAVATVCRNCGAVTRHAMGTVLGA